MTRAIVLAVALAAVAPAAAAPSPPAHRVMSLDLCADVLALALLPPERIASVTTLAREATGPATAARAARVPANRQSAEEVLRQRPDLVLVGAFTAPATVAMLQRLRIATLTVPAARSFAEIRAATRLVGRAVGEPRRAEALLRGMHRDLEVIAASPLPRAPRVASWDATGWLPPAGSLYDTVVTTAGARNVGREPRAAHGGFGLEALLATAPDFLIHERRLNRARGRTADQIAHPLVRRYWGTRWIAIDQDAFVCGSPESAHAAARLHRDLAEALRSYPAPVRIAAP